MEENTIIILTTVDSKKNDIRCWGKKSDEKYDDKIVNKGMGFVVRYEGKIIIITCGHVIRNAKKVYGLKIIKDGIDVIKFELISVVDAIEFDIGILVPQDDLLIDKLFPNPLTIDDFDMTLPKEKENIKIIAMDIVDDKDSIFYKTKVSNWFVKNITIEQIYSNNIPENILINISSQNFFESFVISYNGLSGSPCYNSDDKIVGIIGLEPADQDIFDDVEINVLPIMITFRVIKEYIEYDYYYGACTLYFKSKFVGNDNFKKIHNFNEKYLQVTNNYSIPYEQSISKLENGDVFLFLSDNSIDNNGNVYCPILKYKVPIQTYCMLNFNSSDTIELTVVRNKSKTNLSIQAVPIWKYIYIPFSSNYDGNKNFVEIDGMVFVEISEDIIEYFVGNGIDIVGPFIDVHTTNKYRKDNERIIVLIDLANKDVIEKINYQEFEQTYSNEESETKYVPTLRKMNGKKIINILDLKSKMKSEKCSNIELELEIGNNVIIKF